MHGTHAARHTFSTNLESRQVLAGHIELAHLQELEEQLVHNLQHTAAHDKSKHKNACICPLSPGGEAWRARGQARSPHGGTEGGGSDRNRLALNIHTTSGYTRGVTALGMVSMNSIISVSAARLISFDYRHEDSMRDGNGLKCT